jgi:hypothetical protein
MEFYLPQPDAPPRTLQSLAVWKHDLEQAIFDRQTAFAGLSEHWHSGELGFLLGFDMDCN